MFVMGVTRNCAFKVLNIAITSEQYVGKTGAFARTPPPRRAVLIQKLPGAIARKDFVGQGRGGGGRITSVAEMLRADRRKGSRNVHPP